MSDDKRWWHQDKSRKITERILVEGTLTLQTPTALGGGDGDLTDMPLLVDLGDGKSPLLTGASLAGALRSYLRTLEKGYLVREDDREEEWGTLAQTLFGGEYGKNDGVQLMDQSAMIVDDALGKATAVELRYGVKLNPATRTAADDKLFDRQLWPAGTTFPLRLELLIRESDPADLLKRGLAAALSGLSRGEIRLGGRKRRGYGAVKVDSWQVKQFDMRTIDGLLDWLEEGDKPLAEQNGVTAAADIYQALGVTERLEDNRRFFALSAAFRLDGSLLIRSANVKGEQAADFVHLRALQANGESKPVLSGTSLAGALRARALKIANTVGDASRAEEVVNSIFGPEMGEKKDGDGKNVKVEPRASRLLVRETVIEQGVANLVQNRVGIDRFTGGARDTALFNEQPVWGRPETRVTVDLRLINPADADIGLLLLLLKDLWTGDLPLGGESSVGRGRLRGVEAELTLNEPEKVTTWEIREENGRLQFGGSGSQDDLQDKYLSAFLQEVGHGS